MRLVQRSFRIFGFRFGSGAKHGGKREKMKRITTAFIGFGYRGRQLFRLAQCMPMFHPVAVADPMADPSAVPHDVICYNRGADDYSRMLDEQKPELVFVSSPWEYHTTHVSECLQHGCRVAVEIKGGLWDGEYHRLIQQAQQQALSVYPLENTLFLREIQSVFRMVTEGFFGELVYLRGGYRHDLRHILLDDEGRIGQRAGTESVWRGRFYQTLNADIYPTHGLAPLYLMAGIGRTDSLLRLTSFASKAAGLHAQIARMKGDTRQTVTLGDVISTQMETRRGVLISLTHDTTLPRPRGLDFEVQGTRGIWNGDERKIYLDTMPTEEWTSDEPYIARYESLYWQRWGAEAMQHDTHHNGMDYIMLKAVEADIRGEMPYPATLTDLAAWTAVTPLSGRSIAERRTVDFEF